MTTDTVLYCCFVLNAIMPSVVVSLKTVQIKNALHSDCSGEISDVNVLPHFIYSHQTTLFINLFQLLFVSYTTLYNRPIL
jgi:hypothetical protein